ncbi:hypothetical protein [Variovorax sp. EL159]|uniref:hypothetical protein n=1 Tax=Variovorax sp. EL159 TaxID=1566270 RepID=UPI00115FA4E9|nr:hypothetical protein [Variovorax sp. EL159]
MSPLEVIAAKRAHLARLANQAGAAGEVAALDAMANWIPRPRGRELKELLLALEESGVVVKGSSFDAIAMPRHIDLGDPAAVRAALPEMVFIEIKSANQARTKAGFTGFFFALTESEIAAAEVLKTRHKVALYNKLTGELLMTSIPEILARAKSMTWQLSVQL